MSLSQGSAKERGFTDRIKLIRKSPDKDWQVGEKLSKSKRREAKLSKLDFLSKVDLTTGNRKTGRAIASATAANGAAPGALIGILLESSVGVLLDGIPTSIKNRVKTNYLSKPFSFWKDRAEKQVSSTLYRLVYRNLYDSKKGQLPLPPRALWNFQIGSPKIEVIDGHELVTVDYIFTSTLLTSEASAIASDQNFATVGGVAQESFLLPVDPIHLFERTGYACMDEEDFPPNSVDTENNLSFYDDTCKAGANNFCHVTQPAPSISCVAALKDHVGRMAVSMNFTRLPWSETLAQAVRSGAANPGGADLEVQLDGLKSNRIIYRYISPGSCAIAEGCVGGSGWRRLLQFDGSVANRGSLPAHLGEVEDSSLLVQHNMFEFSACHGHRHFSHYGNFTFGSKAQIGSKRAFCMESTQRYSNNESTPLTHPYSCHYQGIEAGWGDDYIAGIECQWTDITHVNTSKAAVTDKLKFVSNPDKFICEGKPILDANGDFTFEPTPFLTELGQPVDRIACSFASGYELNNTQSLSVTVPKTGGYVTQACPPDRNGAVRNCGFTQMGTVRSCSAGQTVSLKCSIESASAPQIIRACDASKVLGVGMPCTFRDSFATTVLESGKTTPVSLVCPSSKDATEPGGQYSLYTAPFHVLDTAAKVVCQ